MPFPARPPQVQLDPDFFTNPKMQLSMSARLLYLAGLCHCTGALTDGFIDPSALLRLQSQTGTADLRETVDELVSGELWHPAGDLCAGCRALVEAARKGSNALLNNGKGVTRYSIPGGKERHALLNFGEGYFVHDYLDHQPSRAEVLADREGGKQRQAELRKRRRAERLAAGVVPRRGRPPGKGVTRYSISEEKDRNALLNKNGAELPADAPSRARVSPPVDVLKADVSTENLGRPPVSSEAAFSRAHEENTAATTGRDRRPPRPDLPPLTPEEIASLHRKWDATFPAGPSEVDDRTAAALAHHTRRQWDATFPYVDNWLRRDADSLRKTPRPATTTHDDPAFSQFRRFRSTP